MTKAKQFSVGMAKYYYGKHHNAPSSCGASNDDITHTLPHNKIYVISYHETNHTNGPHTGSCTACLTGMNPSTQIHPEILSWLADNWDIEIGSDQDSIECYMAQRIMLIQIITMMVRGKIGLTYHLGKMSKVCSKWFHPEYCCSISITLLMTMESIAMKSELLCRHVITKWVVITLGGYVWKRHTYAAAASYP
jgi:hypothetical protein